MGKEEGGRFVRQNHSESKIALALAQNQHIQAFN